MHMTDSVAAGPAGITNVDIIAGIQDGELKSGLNGKAGQNEKDELLHDFRTITTMLQVLRQHSPLSLPPPPPPQPKSTELRVLNALATLFIQHRGVVAVASTGRHPYDDVSLVAVESASRLNVAGGVKSLGYVTIQNARHNAIPTNTSGRVTRKGEGVKPDDLKKMVMRQVPRYPVEEFDLDHI